MSDTEIIKQLAKNGNLVEAIKEYQKAHPGTSEEYAKCHLSKLVAQSLEFTNHQKNDLIGKGLNLQSQKEAEQTPEQALAYLGVLFLIGMVVMIFVKLGVFGGIIAILCIPGGAFMLADAFHQGFRSNKR